MRAALYYDRVVQYHSSFGSGKGTKARERSDHQPLLQPLAQLFELQDAVWPVHPKASRFTSIRRRAAAG
jgi:hypothetical protein